MTPTGASPITYRLVPDSVTTSKTYGDGVVDLLVAATPTNLSSWRQTIPPRFRKANAYTTAGSANCTTGEWREERIGMRVGAKYLKPGVFGARVWGQPPSGLKVVIEQACRRNADPVASAESKPTMSTTVSVDMTDGAAPTSTAVTEPRPGLVQSKASPMATSTTTIARTGANPGAVTTTTAVGSIAVGTREYPVMMHGWGEISSKSIGTWRVTIHAVDTKAGPRIYARNRGEHALQPGQDWVIVDLSASYEKAPDGKPGAARVPQSLLRWASSAGVVREQIVELERRWSDQPPITPGQQVRYEMAFVTTGPGLLVSDYGSRDLWFETTEHNNGKPKA